MVIKHGNMNIRLAMSEVYGIVRVITFDENLGEVFYAANDLATSLGYRFPRQTIEKMDIYKTIIPLETIKWILNPDQYDRRMVYKTVVTDYNGMMKLVMGSTLPSAEAFKDWLIGIVRMISDGTLKDNVELLEAQLDQFNIIPREAVIQQRKNTMSALKLNQQQSTHMYDGITNSMYRGLFGTDAPGLRRLVGLNPGTNLRNHFNNDALNMVQQAEHDVENIENSYTENNITMNQSHLPDIENTIGDMYGDNPYNIHSNYPVYISPFDNETNKSVTKEGFLLNLLQAVAGKQNNQ